MAGPILPHGLNCHSLKMACLELVLPRSDREAKVFLLQVDCRSAQSQEQDQFLEPDQPEWGNFIPPRDPWQNKKRAERESQQIQQERVEPPDAEESQFTITAIKKWKRPPRFLNIQVLQKNQLEFNYS